MADLAERLGEFPRRYCPVCRTLRDKEFGAGPGGRPDARCLKCGSLERHRFFAILLDVLRPTFGDLGLLLDIAPSPQTTKLLAALEPRTYVRVDLGADNRLVDVLGDLTRLPHPDNAADLVICYHVLEHVPDDLAAMREIARVLSPDGVGLVQVPYRPGTLTDEDPDAPEDERLRRFGQADHVRYYGDDFEDRLVACGLAFERVTPRSLVGAHMATWLHLMPDEAVWIVRRAENPTVPPRVDPDDVAATGLTSTFDGLLSEMTRLHARLNDRRHDVRRLTAQVEALSGGSDPRQRLRSLPARVARRARALLGRRPG
ncbi:class I SAM-dependent methyltransferase [Nocardioides sp.]|uniref:class I SAM-dependent methyltransferase n=1 Tax=Nocardioides sp. TaxID=35761 RepID=UPI003567C68A